VLLADCLCCLQFLLFRSPRKTIRMQIRPRIPNWPARAHAGRHGRSGLDVARHPDILRKSVGHLDG